MHDSSKCTRLFILPDLDLSFRDAGPVRVDVDRLQGWESESECQGGLSERCPEGSLDKKEGFEDHFWYLELKFGADFLRTGHLSRPFDPATGSIKMRNHFLVILALSILYQLPYGAKYFVRPKTHVFFGKLVGSPLIPKRELITGSSSLLEAAAA